MRFRTLDRRPRILFVGTDQLQDWSGTLQALAEIGEVTPFDQADGTYGQTTPDRQLSVDLAIPIGRRILELAAAADDAGRSFDLLIGQMWDGYIDGAALSQVRDRYGTLIVNIGMDDRHAFAVRKLGRTIGTRGLIPYIDLAATAAPEAVDWYRKDGCPAIFFPQASDPILFRPMPEVSKRFDVSFVGARYGIRHRIVERLQEAGVAVEARGSGWPGGRIPTDDVPELFAASKIILGVGTVGHSDSLYALKLRDFDAPMSGSCYLTHDNPDLGQLFEIGREIAVYRNDFDCVRVVRQLLEDDERREAIALSGRQRALQDHTWRGRLNNLLAVLRGASAR
ncbi:MAG: CgeB family protein [Candidatus Limnocylindrales bacterium]